MAIVVLVVWLAFAALGGWVATAKNRPGGEGAIMGLLFGPFGCLIEALLPTLGVSGPGNDAGDDDDDALDPTRVNPRDHAAEADRRRRTEVDRHRAFEAQIREARRDYARRRVERREARREWTRRMIWRFGWFKLLPDVAQPVVIGFAVALPIIALIARVLR